MVSPSDASWIAALETQTPGLVAFLTMLVRRRDLAEDLAQEVCLEAWRGRARFRLDGDLGKWLRGMARMIVLRHRRDDARRSAITLSPEVLELLDASWGESWRPEAHRRDIEALRDCLAGLDGAERNWLEDHYENATPLKDLATRIGRTEDAVKMLFSRLRKKLFDCVARRTGKEVQDER